MNRDKDWPNLWELEAPSDPRDQPMGRTADEIAESLFSYPNVLRVTGVGSKRLKVIVSRLPSECCPPGEQIPSVIDGWKIELELNKRPELRKVQVEDPEKPED